MLPTGFGSQAEKKQKIPTARGTMLWNDGPDADSCCCPAQAIVTYSLNSSFIVGELFTSGHIERLIMLLPLVAVCLNTVMVRKFADSAAEVLHPAELFNSVP